MPEPSRLVLVDQLHLSSAATKVRFLGCVHAYDVASASLILKDHYPATELNTPTVHVSLDNILESMNHELLQTGAWLHVIGYTRPMATEPKRSKRSVRPQPRITLVDAIMVWSAGAIKFDKYCAAVQAYQDAASADAT